MILPRQVHPKDAGVQAGVAEDDASLGLVSRITRVDGPLVLGDVEQPGVVLEGGVHRLHRRAVVPPVEEVGARARASGAPCNHRGRVGAHTWRAPEGEEADDDVDEMVGEGRVAQVGDAAAYERLEDL